MANIKGTFQGSALAAQPPYMPGPKFGGAPSQILANDTAEFSTSAVADTIELGTFPVDTWLDPDASLYKYDALGTGVTVSIGDATYPAALASAASCSSAGSRAALASVDIANHPKPLWELLGYASRAAAVAANSKGITLFARVAAASTTASGTLTWLLKGIIQ